MSTEQQTERAFPLHSLESAPPASLAVMRWFRKTFRMVPNVARVLATSPSLLLSNWRTQNYVLKHASLTAQEIRIVAATVAHENQCQYCVASHTAFAQRSPDRNSPEWIETIRSDSEFDDSKLNALRDFTLRILYLKGRVADCDLRAFFEAGYRRVHALDVVACISAEIMTNFANQMALTPLDEPLSVWSYGLPYREPRRVIEL